MPGAGARRTLEYVQEYLEYVTQIALASPWLLGVIVAMAVVDALLPVVPSEALIIGAGVAAAGGQQDLLVVIGAAALGSFIGEVAGYVIGRALGPAVRGRLGGGRAAAYDRVAALLARRGGTVVLTARFLPGGRTVATLVAGAMTYPTGRFLAFTALGTPLSAAWSAVLGYLGGATFAQNPLYGLAFGLSLGTVAGLVLGAVPKLRARRAATRPAPAPVAVVVPQQRVPEGDAGGVEPVRVLTGAAAS
ncbi:DedA family protein [Pseudonocardia humida]|uniref:DedA family protein n=1 Tax=Pseudonocardia humida TaxID=2800819 RepID=A0ABT1ACF6_9PSEU|nr:DedA family protein [Pseudonocardia humida]MCO1660641.1 DedA family protein [Pseudonocardia humida]